MAAYDRRTFAGAAVATTLTAGITSGDTTIAIAASTGWPTGSTGNFFVVIARGLAAEEKIEISTRTSLSLAVVTRGADGTTAAAHSSGDAIEICLTARDLDEANVAANKTVGKATAAGQILVVDAANSFAAVQAKTSGQILVGSGSTLASVAVSGDATLASSGALTIANDAVSYAKIQNVTTARLLGRATAGSGDTEEITLNANSLDFSGGALRIAAAAAGSGLTGGAGSALAVGVDGTTIEVTTDALNVKAASIGTTQLAVGIPRGFLGYAESGASDQTGIGNGSYVDLTGVSVAVTAGTNRKLKITVFAAPAIGTVATDVRLAVRESTTVLGQFGYMNSFNANPAEFTLIAVAYVAAPSSGAHTYKASVQFGANSDNFVDNSFIKSWILVEDIGGV